MRLGSISTPTSRTTATAEPWTRRRATRLPGNPLAGQPTFTGTPGSQTFVADLGRFAGATAQIRFRVGSDSSIGAAPVDRRRSIDHGPRGLGGGLACTALGPGRHPRRDGTHPHRGTNAGDTTDHPDNRTTTPPNHRTTEPPAAKSAYSPRPHRTTLSTSWYTSRHQRVARSSTPSVPSGFSPIPACRPSRRRAVTEHVPQRSIIVPEK
jgi:hypothetical protein